MKTMILIHILNGINCIAIIFTIALCFAIMLFGIQYLVDFDDVSNDSDAGQIPDKAIECLNELMDNYLEDRD